MKDKFILSVTIKIIADKEQDFFKAIVAIQDIIKAYPKRSQFRLTYTDFNMFFSSEININGYVTINLNGKPFCSFISEESSIDNDFQIADYFCNLLNEKGDTICPSLKFSLNPVEKENPT